MTKKCDACNGTGVNGFVSVGLGDDGLGAIINSSHQPLGGGLCYGVGFDGNGFTPVYAEEKAIICEYCQGIGYIQVVDNRVEEVVDVEITDIEITFE